MESLQQSNLGAETFQLPSGARSPAEPPSRPARSIGAVLAGLVTIFVVTTATDIVLHVTGIFPPMSQRMSDSLFFFAAVYRVAYGILGCYVAARLAPHRPMRHALVLGAVGVVISTAGAVAMSNAGPAWYSLGVIATSLPCAWAGAKLVRSPVGSA